MTFILAQMPARRSGPVSVVVSGPPASGKTTLATAIARELQLPLIAKDVIKDALMEALPVPDVETSRQLGGAAVRAMLAVAAVSPIGAVVESNFYRSVSGPQISNLPGRIVEIFCRCDPEIAEARYKERAGTRHAGHFDHVRTKEELWNEEVCEPVGGGWPIIEVDTNLPVELSQLLERLRALMATDE